MQRYEPAVCQPSNFEIRASLVKEGEFPRNHLDAVPVYIASEVDARIDELHRIVATLWNDVDPIDYEDIRESVMVELAQRTGL
jgi:hypothetical protein